MNLSEAQAINKRRFEAFQQVHTADLAFLAACNKVRDAVSLRDNAERHADKLRHHAEQLPQIECEGLT